MMTTRRIDQRGFTVIELVVVAVILAAAAILVFIQINNLTVARQDEQRKTAINAMYYALEEVYYKEHSSYPASIKPDTLPSVDPALFTDPDGFTLGKEIISDEEAKKIESDGNMSDETVKLMGSILSGKSPNYHYDATNCDTSGNCKSYTLRADMAKEAQYVKKSRSH